jgi:tryptophanyl-tRNA synthetase
MTREIGGKFNRAYGVDLFKMPQQYVRPEVATVPGIDGEKMSKSYGNVIPLFGTDEEIRKAVMGIVTDSATPEDKKNPDENTIYKIHKLFLNTDEDRAVRARYEEGGLGYKEAKDMLFNSIISFISPKREKYDHYQANPEEVHKILNEGAARARVKAKAMMEETRKVTGLR